MTSNCAELAHIHDRSPVILDRADWATWLNAPLGELAQFDRPWPAADIAVQETAVLWKDGGKPETLPPSRGGEKRGARVIHSRWAP